jgi:hypothetical protein
MALTTPLVNGNYPSFADVILRIGVAGGATIQIVGVTSIDYDDDLKRAPVYGAQTVQLGLTNGKYEAHGSITLLLNPANLLIATLGAIGIPFGGFRYVPITVSVAYAAIGPLPTVLDSFVCYLGKQDSKNKVGDEPSERTFALYINGAISWNGFPGAFDLNSTLAVA